MNRGKGELSIEGQLSLQPVEKGHLLVAFFSY